jgi:hypothetical protein
MGAIIDSGELIQVFADLTGIDLHSIPRHRACIAFEFLRAPKRSQHPNAMAMEHFPDGACRKVQVMQAQQLALKAFGTQMARAAHFQEEGFML